MVGFGLLGVGALLLAWLALGLNGAGDVDEVERTTVPVAGIDARTAEWTRRQQEQGLVPIDADPEKAPPPLPLDEDPNIRVVTANCRQLIGHQRRNVDQSTLLDIVRDGNMRFTDDDLQCMSVGGAAPSILDMAARQPKY